MTNDRPAEIRTTTATPDRWRDVVVAFGNRANDPDWCWCQRLTRPTVQISNREALKAEVTTATVPPGIIAYLNDEPVGWSRVMPRNDVAGVARNRALRRILDDNPGAWWVVCFAVQQRHRNAGIATALLAACVDHARSQGATCIEGHPVDTSQLKAERVGGSALFTGTMNTFTTAGFDEIARTYPSRPLMRLNL